MRLAATIIVAIIIVLVIPRERPEEVMQPQAVPTATSTEELSKIYVNNGAGYSIQVPKNYIIDEFYSYHALGPGKNISGVQFQVATSTTYGTNLGSDTYISVEELLYAKNCTAGLFLNNAAIQTILEGEMMYSVASSVGAAAGNRYEETVYALPNTNPCLAVRYYIHYGAIENYPRGVVREFDKKLLLQEFDVIRRSLTITK